MSLPLVNLYRSTSNPQSGSTPLQCGPQLGCRPRQSLPRGVRWFRRGNPGLRRRFLFDRLQNNALGHLVYLDAELLYRGAELLYAALNVGEFKGQGLKLLDQFNGSYKCGGRCLTVGRRLCCRDRQQPGQGRNLRPDHLHCFVAMGLPCQGETNAKQKDNEIAGKGARYSSTY